MLTALAMWIFVSAGVVDYDCYGVVVAPEVDVVEPPPPPTEGTDGQCFLLEDQHPGRRPQISNGF